MMCLFMLSRRSWNDPRRAVRDRVPGGRGGRDGGDVVKFFVPGNAIPKQSFRYSRTGGYTDPRVTAWQSTIGYFAELNGVEVRKGKAKVTLLFLLKDRRRRDLDNLSKAVLDALNGIAWVDDTQIVDLHIVKAITKESPGVWIEIEEA